MRTNDILTEYTVIKPLATLKTEIKDFNVEFEVLPVSISATDTNMRKQYIADGLNIINERLAQNQSKFDELNKEIDRLTNHADGLDYMVAVGSGILAGIVDSFWVGEFSFSSGKAWSNQQVNGFVMNTAKQQGYTGDRLDGAINFLENKYPSPTDAIWKGQNIGVSARSHHLDDLAHHPSPIGLFFSVLTQFTRTGYFQNSGGSFIPISVDPNGYGLIGNNVPNKIFAGTVNWFFHLVSDMSGSNKTAGVGMGIPGPIGSLIKELSVIPGLNKTGLSQQISNAFVKNRFDLRNELAIGQQLARQAVPVILNEVLVRAFYFIRRLIGEIKEKGNFRDIEWNKCLPWKNRTIVRMLTIATATFTIVDLADAAIRAGLKSGGTPLFFKEFILRINFVGVGRFALAVGTDVYMGVRRSKLRNQRIALYSEQLQLMNAKIFYLQADVWVTAETTQKAIREAYSLMEQTTIIFINNLQAIWFSLDDIELSIPLTEENNPGITEEMEDVLKWGV